MKKEELKNGINYYRLLNALADSMLDIPDDVVFEIEKVSGHDPSLLADGVKNIIKKADLQFKRSKLTTAKKAYEEILSEYEKLKTFLPPSAQGRKKMFLAVLKKYPSYEGIATFQHRNFEDLTDDDIESALKQFYELGLLDHLNNDEENK